MIHYLSGMELLAFDETWYEQVEYITRTETYLLTKTRADLEPVAKDGRVLIAVDADDLHKVVGCIVLWDLGRDERDEQWYELGTFFVRPEYRFGRTHLPIGDQLYARLLEEQPEKNILGTTGNKKAIHTGARHGMQMIRFGQLPEAVRRATCICPIEKTGATNNFHCRAKDSLCRVRVSTPTWDRMGRPERLFRPLSDDPPTNRLTKETS